MPRNRNAAAGGRFCAISDTFGAPRLITSSGPSWHESRLLLLVSRRLASTGRLSLSGKDEHTEAATRAGTGGGGATTSS